MIINNSEDINMSRLRVETARHPRTGKVYVELYYPENEVIPIAISEPIYINRDDAIRHAIETFDHWMSHSIEKLLDEDQQ